MEAVFQIKKKLFRAKRELLDVKVNLKFARFLRAATKAGFNEGQPRDEDGRWAAGGSSNGNDQQSGSAENGGEGSIAYLLAVAGKQSAAYCWNQMQIDMLMCSTVQPAWQRAVCRGQANQRYGACLAGTQIPPLSY